MELSSTSILLILGYIILIVALITIIISYANYKDEKDKEVENLNKDYDLAIQETEKLKEEVRKRKNYEKYIDADVKDLKEALAHKTKSESSLQRKVEVLAEENKFLIEHGPKVLKLNVAAKLYDKLVDGTEIAVPLAYNKYWKKRLSDDDGVLKEFHLAEVSNGTQKGYQTTKFIVNYSEVAQKEKSNEDSKFFHIYLGERLN
ncbi:MAG: hypothetical protein WC121_10640 [Candidatus Kapaibacterium sp.]